VVTLKCENRQAINHQREMVARAVDQMTKRIIRIGGYGMLKVEYVDGKFVVNNYAYSTSGLPATQRKKITRAIESFQRCNIKQKDGTPIKNRLTITVIVG